MCSICEIGPINPILIHIGPLKIHWYGIWVAIGFYLAYLYATSQFKQKKLPLTIPNDLFVCGVIGGIIGARIWYVATFYHLFQDNFWGMFKVWQGGLVFNGGFIGASITILSYCLIKKLPLLPIADILAVSLPIGHAFGRIGCWINGCCYGKEGHGLLSMKHFLPDGSTSTAYFPIQLLGTIGNLSLALFLFILSKRIKQPGWLLPLYFVCYGTTRLFGEHFRGDFSGARQVIFNYPLSPAQVVSLTFTIPIGIFLLVGMFFYYKNQRQNDASQPNQPQQTKE